MVLLTRICIITGTGKQCLHYNFTFFFKEALLFSQGFHSLFFRIRCPRTHTVICEKTIWTTYCSNLDNNFKYNLNNKGKVFSSSSYNMSWRQKGEVLIYSVLTLVLDRGGWSMPYIGHFFLGKKPQHPLQEDGCNLGPIWTVLENRKTPWSH